MITLDQTGGIARLTLDRPAQRNALATSDWRALAETIARIPREAAVVLLQSSSPGIFSAGADLRDLALLADEPARRAPSAKRCAPASTRSTPSPCR